MPSGNFGNLCAGLFAAQCGLPVPRFIAAVNANSVVPEYLESGVFRPRPSVATLSNAMDVGNPSNWERIRTLFNDDHGTIAERLWSVSISDETTLETQRTVFDRRGTIVDPHTAVGLAAAEHFRSRVNGRPILVLSTAHPAKFPEIVQRALGIDVELPTALKECLRREKQATPLANSYAQLKDFLMSLD